MPAPAPCTRRRVTARTTTRWAGVTGCRSTIRSAATGDSLPARRSSRDSRCSTPTQRSSRRSNEAGRLIHFETYRHSYPHCWRHKSPVIFRATPQWFLSMEKAGLRRDALAAIRGVRWIPCWGEQRITSMIETRPGLVHLAPARLGRAARDVRAQGNGRAASADAGAAGTASPNSSPRAASRPGSR